MKVDNQTAHDAAVGSGEQTEKSASNSTLLNIPAPTHSAGKFPPKRPSYESHWAQVTPPLIVEISPKFTDR